MGVITAKGVTFAYREKPAIQDVSTTVSEAECVVLAGLSGSGKSTLLRCFNGLIPHSTGGSFRGDVFIGETNTRDVLPRVLSAEVGFVHQDPDAHTVVDVVEREISFALENRSIDEVTMRRRVEESLDALNIVHLRQRATSSLSGGERQRVALAAALAGAPSVLLLDEPTAQLDPQGAEDVASGLTRLRNELGMSIVIAEHRLDRLLDVADRAIVLRNGSVVADADPAIAFDQYEAPPVLFQIARKRQWETVPTTVARAKQLASSEHQLTLPTTTTPSFGESTLSARDLSFAYEHNSVVNEVDVELHEGECVAIVGRNGSGKTTLLKLLANLLKPNKGTIDTNSRAGYIPQNPNAMLFASTVRESIAETTRLLGLPEQNVAVVAERLGLNGLLDRHPRDLSLGERQLASIATVAVGIPDLLFADEPTRGTDLLHQHQLAQMFGDLCRDGKTVAFATHDIEFAARVASRVIVLADGEIIADGDARTVLCSSLFAPITSRIFPGFLTPDELS